MMTYSEDGLALTKSFEGCRLKAYQDQGGVWTIGYGHTRGVKAGDVCTQEQAEEWLREDVAFTVASVNKLAPARFPVSQNQFDALVDFAFNLGAGALRTSTLLLKLICGDLPGAASEFARWNHVGGVENKGLTRRRAAEKSLFEGKPWE